MNNFLKNYCSTLLFIGLLYLFYTNNQYYIGFLSGDYSFSWKSDFVLSIQEIFIYILYGYALILIPFYIFQKEKSKARIVMGYFKNYFTKKKYIICKEEKNALLAWIVKAFFAPIMIFWLTGHIFSMLNNIYNGSQNISLFSTDFLLFFNQYFFHMAFSTILFADVVCFTLGYLIEGNIFKNKIKSVEPTIFGWVVVLICYPPFNTSLNNIIGWYSSDFPQFGTWYIHLFLNICILVLMSIYSRASFSLGLKASNLTNRGIISKGPYKYVRHPAYISKNLAWWIGGLAFIISTLQSDNKGMVLLAFISLSTRSYIYYLRAKTEENHLLQDPEYVQYVKKVPYMFIPGVK